MEIVYVYQKKRSEFGKQALLSDRPAEVSLAIQPDPAYMKNYVERNPSHTEVQATPDKSEHEVNTESYVVNSCGILHTQGGWPKDVDATDVEHTIRFRKKIEKDEEYMRVIKNLGESMEHTIKQNNAIDIYQEYFPDSGDSASSDAPSAKSLNVYRDPNSIKRAATYLSWYPEEGHKIAVAYSVLQFQGMPANMSLDSYIWDVENPNAPDQTLTPTSPLVCIKYNPKDPHILVGGSYNGLLSYWDTRKGAFPVDTSPQEKSHRDPVYNVAWALWWDIRKLSEPTETMLIDPEKNGSIVGGTVLDFESTMPTKFMIGGENGATFMCNKKAKTPGDKITHIYPGHHGPVYALQRNPFFLKNFLTVGDWKAQIWSEDIRSPIMSTKYSMSYLTDGCWSPTRPSVFFTAKMDGSIDIWDYVFKQVEPSLTVQMLEREAKREKTLESAVREKRIKAAQKRPNSAITPTGPALEELLKAADDEFFELIDDGSGQVREEAKARALEYDA
ncbi:Dynein intermediate chain 2, axonemal [Kappamyces sp. JEL0829]|nr:Dynein intermediate chain 2, axonemal [Kappamyces sp. JEL0829]